MAAPREAGRPRGLLAATVCAGIATVLTACTAGPPPPTSAPVASTSTSTPTATTPTAGTPTATTPTATTTPTAGPPFIAGARWVRGSGGRSLHILPTASGRVARGATDDDEAWAEVLRFAPDADQPGMRMQFDCHWVYARLVQPDKPSWNLEPWRPLVTASQMADAGCNPGVPESAES